jgi:hypothetical protein
MLLVRDGGGNSVYAKIANYFFENQDTHFQG